MQKARSKSKLQGVRRSPFIVHRSSFTVHRSPFIVHRSPAGVRGSGFGVRSLAFAWRCGWCHTGDCLTTSLGRGFVAVQEMSWRGSLATPSLIEANIVLYWALAELPEAQAPPLQVFRAPRSKVVRECLGQVSGSRRIAAADRPGKKKVQRLPDG
jgi:hypothetical protein